MLTKRVGNITELEVELAFAKFGYPVLVPFGDCERYDLVVDHNGRFYRIQVKTSHEGNRSGSFSFECRSSHRRDGKYVQHQYDESEIDYFATMYGGKCYLVPVNECGVGKTLRLEETKSGMQANISWAKDYELETVIKSW